MLWEVHKYAIHVYIGFLSMGFIWVISALYNLVLFLSTVLPISKKRMINQIQNVLLRIFCRILRANSLCTLTIRFIQPSGLPPNHCWVHLIFCLLGWNFFGGLSIFFCNHCVVLAINSFAFWMLLQNRDRNLTHLKTVSWALLM